MSDRCGRPVVSVAGVAVVGQLVASGPKPPRVEPFFLHVDAPLGTADPHTFGYLTVIWGRLQLLCTIQGQDVGVNSLGCLLKETVPFFPPSHNEAKVWSWMSDSGVFPSGAALLYLREVNAWKSLARLMSE